MSWLWSLGVFLTGFGLGVLAMLLVAHNLDEKIQERIWGLEKAVMASKGAREASNITLKGRESGNVAEIRRSGSGVETLDRDFSPSNARMRRGSDSSD